MKRYTVSLIWHPTLTTGVLPLLGLLYMNSHIFLTIRWSSNSAFVGKLYFIICTISDNERKIYLYISSERPGRSWADVKASKGKVNLISRWISIQQTASRKILLRIFIQNIAVFQYWWPKGSKNIRFEKNCETLKWKHLTVCKSVKFMRSRKYKCSNNH